MKASIIIPTLNEEKTIYACLSALQGLRNDCEIIIADGGSSDNTRLIADALTDKIIISPAGRALQMNSGAALATGNILIFLHADTRLPDPALQLIQQQIGITGLWGRFDIQLSGTPFMLKVIAQMMNWRSRLTGIATGDQVIFVTRQAFEQAGRFPAIALMEDIALCAALKKIGPPINLKAKVISSGRRWQRNGVCKTIALMWYLRVRYYFGADPQMLAALYRHGTCTRFKFNGWWERL